MIDPQLNSIPNPKTLKGISDEYHSKIREQQIKLISEKLNAAAAEGKYHVYLSLDPEKRLISMLESKGFKVEFSPADLPGETNSLKISFE